MRFASFHSHTPFHLFPIIQSPRYTLLDLLMVITERPYLSISVLLCKYYKMVGSVEKHVELFLTIPRIYALQIVSLYEC
jgi:hypothetical protein